MGTIGKVLPILRLKQLGRNPLINTSVGDDLGLRVGRLGETWTPPTATTVL
ncbi:hypothetical protein PR003_g18147 [Phytophthora rubi]|uniref:Uncharacterized protein n=1 Tax=Phytophthora rubi TaxID=129364 RepID=A0A6A4E9M1_9STRA|nr:hypothetical protein PR003_g18147 [Phytophthora rubi]